MYLQNYYNNNNNDDEINKLYNNQSHQYTTTADTNKERLFENFKQQLNAKGIKTASFNNKDIKYQLANEIINKINKLGDENFNKQAKDNMILNNIIKYQIALNQFHIPYLTPINMYNGMNGYMHPGFEYDESTQEWKKKKGGKFVATFRDPLNQEKPIRIEVTDDEIENAFQNIEDKELLLSEIGLKNLGYTCYMNSTLQMFNAVKTFIAIIKKYTEKHEGDIISQINQNAHDDNNCGLVGNKNKLLLAFVELIYSMQQKTTLTNTHGKYYYSPKHFKNAIYKIDQNVEDHDSHTVIDIITNKLLEETTFSKNIIPQYSNEPLIKFYYDVFFHHDSFINKLFYIFKEKKTQCNNCNHAKKTYDKIFVFMPALESVQNFLHKPVISLRDCFNYELRNQNQQDTKCSYCHRISNHTIQEQFCNEPENMIIKLNRGPDNIYKIKLKTPIFFRSPNGYYYMLSNQISHSGPSDVNGHFINQRIHEHLNSNQLKDNKECNILTYDDSKVNYTDTYTKEFAPYILLYRRIEEHDFKALINDTETMKKIQQIVYNNKDYDLCEMITYQDMYIKRNEQLRQETKDVLNDALLKVLNLQPNTTIDNNYTTITQSIDINGNNYGFIQLNNSPMFFRTLCNKNNNQNTMSLLEIYDSQTKISFTIDLNDLNNFNISSLTFNNNLLYNNNYTIQQMNDFISNCCNNITNILNTAFHCNLINPAPNITQEQLTKIISNNIVNKLTSIKEGIQFNYSNGTYAYPKIITDICNSLAFFHLSGKDLFTNKEECIKLSKDFLTTIQDKINKHSNTVSNYYKGNDEIIIKIHNDYFSHYMLNSFYKIQNYYNNVINYNKLANNLLSTLQKQLQQPHLNTYNEYMQNIYNLQNYYNNIFQETKKANNEFEDTLKEYSYISAFLKEAGQKTIDIQQQLKTLKESEDFYAKKELQQIENDFNTLQQNALTGYNDNKNKGTYFPISGIHYYIDTFNNIYARLFSLLNNYKQEAYSFNIKDPDNNIERQTAYFENSGKKTHIQILSFPGITAILKKGNMQLNYFDINFNFKLEFEKNVLPNVLNYSNNKCEIVYQPPQFYQQNNIHPPTLNILNNILSKNVITTNASLQNIANNDKNHLTQQILLFIKSISDYIKPSQLNIPKNCPDGLKHLFYAANPEIFNDKVNQLSNKYNHLKQNTDNNIQQLINGIDNDVLNNQTVNICINNITQSLNNLGFNNQELVIQGNNPILQDVQKKYNSYVELEKKINSFNIEILLKNLKTTINKVKTEILSEKKQQLEEEKKKIEEQNTIKFNKTIEELLKKLPDDNEFLKLDNISIIKDNNVKHAIKQQKISLLNNKTNIFKSIKNLNKNDYTTCLKDIEEKIKQLNNNILNLQQQINKQQQKELKDEEEKKKKEEEEILKKQQEIEEEKKKIMANLKKQKEDEENMKIKEEEKKKKIEEETDLNNKKKLIKDIKNSKINNINNFIEELKNKDEQLDTNKKNDYINQLTIAKNDILNINEDNIDNNFNINDNNQTFNKLDIIRRDINNDIQTNLQEKTKNHLTDMFTKLKDEYKKVNAHTSQEDKNNIIVLLNTIDDDIKNYQNDKEDQVKNNLNEFKTKIEKISTEHQKALEKEQQKLEQQKKEKQKQNLQQLLNKYKDISSNKEGYNNLFIQIQENKMKEIFDKIDNDKENIENDIQQFEDKINNSISNKIKQEQQKELEKQKKIEKQQKLIQIEQQKIIDNTINIVKDNLSELNRRFTEYDDNKQKLLKAKNYIPDKINKTFFLNNNELTDIKQISAKSNNIISNRNIDELNKLNDEINQKIGTLQNKEQELKIIINQIKEQIKNEKEEEKKKKEEEEVKKTKRLEEKIKEMINGNDDDMYSKFYTNNNNNTMNFIPRMSNINNNDAFFYKRKTTKNIYNNKPAIMQQQTNNLLQDQAMKQITINAENNNINNVDVGNQQSNSQQLQQEKEKPQEEKIKHKDYEYWLMPLVIGFIIWLFVELGIIKYDDNDNSLDETMDETLIQDNQQNIDNNNDKIIGTNILNNVNQQDNNIVSMY